MERKKKEPEKTDATCETCGHRFEKVTGQNVKVFIKLSSYLMTNRTTEKWYCKEHRKPYDEEVNSSYCADAYYKRMRVDEKGTPLGYEPVKEPEPPIANSLEYYYENWILPHMSKQIQDKGLPKPTKRTITRKCPHCAKPFKKKGVWLERHITKVHAK